MKNTIKEEVNKLTPEQVDEIKRWKRILSDKEFKLKFPYYREL